MLNFQQCIHPLHNIFLISPPQRKNSAEIFERSDPEIILNLEYKQFTKVSDGEKNGSMSAQKNLQDLHKDAKKIILKEPTRYFLSVQTNDRRIRNQPTFVSAKHFDKKSIITVYDSLSTEI